MAEHITFLDQTFDRADLTDTLINYIETYNAIQSIPKNKKPSDRDYQFRMNQALQMFGNQMVVDGITFLIIQSEAEEVSNP